MLSNCAVSHEDLFKIGAAIFNLHRDVGDGAVRAALPFIELSSDAGNTDARYTLAQLLRMGRGVEHNVVRAASLFQELAMKAHPYAQVRQAYVEWLERRGVCVSSGDAPSPSSVPAVHAGCNVPARGWRGAEHGQSVHTLQGVVAEDDLSTSCVASLLPHPQVSAMNLVPESFAVLGKMYKEGLGVSVDLEEAVRCFRRGAELGDVQGHLALAQCYAHGTGVVQSDQEALDCYMKAAEMGG